MIAAGIGRRARPRIRRRRAGAIDVPSPASSNRRVVRSEPSRWRWTSAWASRGEGRAGHAAGSRLGGSSMTRCYDAGDDPVPPGATLTVVWLLIRPRSSRVVPGSSRRWRTSRRQPGPGRAHVRRRAAAATALDGVQVELTDLQGCRATRRARRGALTALVAVRLHDPRSRRRRRTLARAIETRRPRIRQDLRLVPRTGLQEAARVVARDHRARDVAVARVDSDGGLEASLGAARAGSTVPTGSTVPMLTNHDLTAARRPRRARSQIRGALKTLATATGDAGDQAARPFHALANTVDVTNANPIG